MMIEGQCDILGVKNSSLKYTTNTASFQMATLEFTVKKALENGT